VVDDGLAGGAGVLVTVCVDVGVAASVGTGDRLAGPVTTAGLETAVDVAEVAEVAEHAASADSSATPAPTVPAHRTRLTSVVDMSGQRATDVRWFSPAR